MAMKVLDLVQGSDQWLEHRKNGRNASEASMMMGNSSNVGREELIKFKALGLEQEVSDFVQKVVFEQGHKVEELARPIIEKQFEIDLFPVVATSDDGYLSASFDGITFGNDTIWECKQLNKKKLSFIQNYNEVPEEDYWQVVQQFAVSGADKCIYTITDGTEEGTHSIVVERNDDDINLLCSYWAQFDKDVANYEHKEDVQVLPGKAPDQLPALNVEVTGMVTNSNLEQFKKTAMAVFRGINTDLQTDQDFADAEKTVKWCVGVEKKLKDAKDQALAQTTSIEVLFNTIDAIKEEARQTRLTLNKAVKARKESIRNEISGEAVNEINDHVNSLNNRINPHRIPYCDPTIFVDAMKGKRTVSSLREAVSVELARLKVESSAMADKIDANQKIINSLSEGYEHLFADSAKLVQMEKEALESTVKLRILEHKQAEEKRLAEERERIRIEEEAKAKAKAEAEAAAKVKAELERKAEEANKQREEQERKIREAESVQDFTTETPKPKRFVTGTVSMGVPAQMEEDLRAESEQNPLITNAGVEIVQSEKMVSIPEKEYQWLKDRNDWLCCLESAGVDNWSGFEHAQQLADESRKAKSA